MENRNILKSSVLFFLGVIFLMTLARLFPHMPNFTPIGAFALFSGAFFKNKVARYGVPLIIMIISDSFLRFHATMPFVYGCFIFNILLGQLFLKDEVKPLRLASISLISSIIFFVVTNFGVWLVMDMYTKTLAGLQLSYFMGLPFFRNTIVSDLFYSFVFFYGFALIKNNSYKFSHVFRKV